jgi:hypothetical protein
LNCWPNEINRAYPDGSIGWRTPVSAIQSARSSCMLFTHRVDALGRSQPAQTTDQMMTPTIGTTANFRNWSRSTYRTRHKDRKAGSRSRASM